MGSIECEPETASTRPGDKGAALANPVIDRIARQSRAGNACRNVMDPSSFKCRAQGVIEFSVHIPRAREDGRAKGWIAPRSEAGVFPVPYPSHVSTLTTRRGQWLAQAIGITGFLTFARRKPAFKGARNTRVDAGPKKTDVRLSK